MSTPRTSDRRLTGWWRGLDAWQQRHPVVGFLYAVYQKSSDDQASNLAALLAYYAFFSVFPLLLVLVTLLGFALQGDPGLQQRLEGSVLSVLPIIGQSDSLHPLTGNVAAVVIGSVLALYNGLGVASQAQTTLNTIYCVPRFEWPGFVPTTLRSVLALVGGGGGLLLTTTVSGYLSSADVFGLHLGVGLQVAGALVSVAFNTVVFTFVFRSLTVYPVRWRDALPGAALNAVIFALTQVFGTALFTHELRGAQQTYGTFATVIGLLALFALLATASLYAAQINVVRTFRLWPRSLGSLSGHASTAADHRAYALYARRDQFAPADEEDVAVTFGGSASAPQRH